MLSKQSENILAKVDIPSKFKFEVEVMVKL